VVVEAATVVVEATTVVAASAGAGRTVAVVSFLLGWCGLHTSRTAPSTGKKYKCIVAHTTFHFRQECTLIC
jgi:hypothetical protein